MMRPENNPGRAGGIASGLRLTPEQRSARAQKGGQSTLERYGREFYAAVARVGVQRQMEKCQNR